MDPSSFGDYTMVLLARLSGGLGVVGLLLTVTCLIHAIMTRQDFWWFLVLILLPPFGSILYLFVVIFKVQGSGVRFNRPARDAGSLRRQIHELENKLAQTDTIALRSELGQAWLKLKNFEQAKQYFTSCLKGNFKNDPFILYGLAQSCYGCGQFPEAIGALEKTFRNDYRDYLNERRFLQAKILAELGRSREALEIYAQLASSFSSPEFFCRQALLHAGLGDQEKADALFLTALRQAAKISPEERKEARPWLNLAEEHSSRKRQG